jgi:hypothetical protein
MSVPSWVAYGSDGRPFGFAAKSRHTLKQAAREFPDEWAKP